jgi:hypothetical protein
MILSESFRKIAAVKSITLQIAGIDDVRTNQTPEDKLRIVREVTAKGPTGRTIGAGVISECGSGGLPAVDSNQMHVQSSDLFNMQLSSSRMASGAVPSSIVRSLPADSP